MNWNTVKTSASHFCANFEMATMCAANATAQPSVIASPKPMESVSPDELTDTSQMPHTATTAATILNAVGRLRAMSHQANGTSTQYVAVRNALMPGVVYLSPTVCSQKAVKSSTPRMNP